MKITSAMIATAMTFAAVGTAFAGNAVDDKDMGLSKTSVFDATAPPAWDYTATQDPMPRYFADAPPMIPHAIGAYENITAVQNLCMGCHKQPDKIGQKVPAEGRDADRTGSVIFWKPAPPTTITCARARCWACAWEWRAAPCSGWRLPGQTSACL